MVSRKSQLQYAKAIRCGNSICSSHGGQSRFLMEETTISAAIVSECHRSHKREIARSRPMLAGVATSSWDDRNKITRFTETTCSTLNLLEPINPKPLNPTPSTLPVPESKIPRGSRFCCACLSRPRSGSLPFQVPSLPVGFRVVLFGRTQGSAIAYYNVLYRILLYPQHQKTLSF